LLREIGIPVKTALFFVAIVMAPNGWSQGLERFLNGVVGVKVGTDSNRAPELGTGFVVSAEGGTLSILTARHLFYEGKNRFSDNISVTFYLDQLNSYKGVLKKDSPNLDLAVLTVENVPARVAQKLPTFIVRPESAPPSIGDDLYAFGGDSQSWEAPAVRVSFPRDGDRPDRFRFTGIGIRAGFSGAALLDSAGRLAAVHLGTVEDDENFGHAQRMAYAYGILADLGVMMNRLEFGGASTSASSAVAHHSAVRVAGTVKENSKDGLNYVWIPAGKFMMGCSPGDQQCSADEKPAHEVEITRGFWMGQTEVTQGAYSRVMKQNPSRFKGDLRPVESVTWSEALSYCAAVELGLPTEAEWEHAARAGSTATTYGELDRVAWYDKNSESATHQVKGKLPNAWGLYDMLGNVAEWVADWYDDPYYGKSPARDPSGPGTGAERVLRGGFWLSIPRGVRVSYRGREGPEVGYPYFGFRCAGELFP
jgi:formylglycine-generating enzyme required for sulfatase activity